MNEKIRKTLSGVKLLASDVDGVLTDGGLYYSESGLTFKKFNVKDGMAVRLLKEKEVYTALISTDRSDIPKMRAERLKMDFCITGSWDKLDKLKEICEELTISLNECAFIGDDVNDLEILSSVGVSFSPSDAVESVRNSVDIVLKSKGGEGAFREAADLILSLK